MQASNWDEFVENSISHFFQSGIHFPVFSATQPESEVLATVFGNGVLEVVVNLKGNEKETQI